MVPLGVVGCCTSLLYCLAPPADSLPLLNGLCHSAAAGHLLEDANDPGHGADEATDGRQLRRGPGPDPFGLLAPAERPPVTPELLPPVLSKVAAQDQAARVVAAELNAAAALPVDCAAVHRRLEEDEEDQEADENRVDAGAERVATKGQEEHSQDAVAPIPPQVRLVARRHECKEYRCERET